MRVTHDIDKLIEMLQQLQADGYTQVAAYDDLGYVCPVELELGHLTEREMEENQAIKDRQIVIINPYDEN